ncbi:MAG: hypothetical protein AB8G96_10835 [Phycisphaerales bacterium]
MERSILGLFIAFILVGGTASIVSLFLVGRTPTGMPVVAPGQASAASDRIIVRDVPFESPIRSTVAGDRRVAVRTKIAAGHRLVDIGLVRIAHPAPVNQRAAWERIRRDPDVLPLEDELEVDADDAADARVARGAIVASAEDPSAEIGRAGDGPLDLRIRRHVGALGWSFEFGGRTFEIAAGRLRILGSGPQIDLPIFGPGRWTVILDGDGTLHSLTKGE